VAIIIISDMLLHFWQSLLDAKLPKAVMSDGANDAAWSLAMRRPA
jgi:hypothetical protein